jgi:hypothetical protein
MGRDRTWLLYLLNWVLVGIGLAVVGSLVLYNAP